MSKLLIANWKSHKTISAAQNWCAEFLRECPSTEQTVILTPSYTLLSAVQEAIQDTFLLLGAQDVSPYPQGAYTGAISADQLSDLGVQYVIVGHSERRQHFHETSADVARKITQAISVGLTPVVCVDMPYADEQLSLLSAAELAKCVIAYEPLESIGNGNAMDVGTVKNAVVHLHTLAPETPVLYGGSVDPESVAEYCLVTDGVLVGTASLEAATFAKLVNALQLH